jgi:hypothetical protein
MAEMLKRQYDLVVFKVDMQPTRPNVLFTLQAKVDGALTDIRSWPGDITELGLLRDRDATVACTLPTSMVSELAAWMSENTTGMSPLWVHLVKPYGALRFMPWERAFGSDFPQPILMLPDFIFPPPREASETLDVALLASAPLHVEDYLVKEAVRNTVGGIITAAVRRTELHVFADQDMYSELHTLMGMVTDSAVKVTLYDPREAEPYVVEDLSSRLVDQTGQLRSPWLLWMRNELRRNSVDVFHFVGHGSLTRDRGALLVAQSPMERTREFRAGPISATELATFMTQVGAWGTALTVARQNNSEPGLRAIADEIGQTRPGPVLMHNAERDPSLSMMRDAYRLLFDTMPAGMPKSDALFVYCQPYRVRSGDTTELEVGTQRRVRSDITLESPVSRNANQTRIAQGFNSLSSPLDSVIERSGTVKPWVAATERVAEQVQLKMLASVRDDDDEDSAQTVRQNAADSVLASLRESVAAFAEEDAASEASFVIPIIQPSLQPIDEGGTQ